MIPIGAEDALKLTAQYGVVNVILIILVIFFVSVFFFMLRWVVQMNKDQARDCHLEKMELASLINVGQKAITDALNQNTMVCRDIMKTAGDNFDSLKRANDYQRSEITSLQRAVEDKDCRFQK